MCPCQMWPFSYILVKSDITYLILAERPFISFKNIPTKSYSTYYFMLCCYCPYIYISNLFSFQFSIHNSFMVHHCSLYKPAFSLTYPTYKFQDYSQFINLSPSVSPIWSTYHRIFLFLTVYNVIINSNSKFSDSPKFSLYPNHVTIILHKVKTG